MDVLEIPNGIDGDLFSEKIIDPRLFQVGLVLWVQISELQLLDDVTGAKSALCCRGVRGDRGDLSGYRVNQP